MWWLEGDNPWQVLAICNELHSAVRAPDPEAFESGFPVHQDGCLSRHFSTRLTEGATSRCQHTLKSVGSVLPSFTVTCSRGQSMHCLLPCVLTVQAARELSGINVVIFRCLEKPLIG